MGRKKIEIQYIESQAKRNATLRKRTKGLMDKAKQLSALCDSDVMIIVMNHNVDELHPDHTNNHVIQTYCSKDDMKQFWKAYVHSTQRRAKCRRIDFGEKE